jgi:diguanylate cyclase (GGDEF)-like protein/PAS domain S-box-containing protein
MLRFASLSISEGRRDTRNAVDEAERRYYKERIRDLETANERLAGEKELFQVTLACIGDAVITTDVAGYITNLNPVAEKLTGWSNLEAQGTLVSQVFKILTEAAREPAADPLTRCLRDREAKGLDEDTLLVRRDGVELSIDDTATPIFDTAGELAGAVLIFRDVTEQRRLVRQLKHQAFRDVLTGLINRRGFERRLKRLLSSNDGDQLHGLLYVDLDQFKVVNDTCGHVVGDVLLCQVSALLRSKVKRSDTLARLGGDEFGVLLENCSKEQARHIANELRLAIQDFHFHWAEKSFTIGVSIGVVPIAPGHESLPKLLSAADSACYIAKEKGRNRIHVYELDCATVHRHDQMQWVARIHDALREDRFCLYHQPIVPLSRNALPGEHWEILVRLLDEDGRLILPDAFIPAAEHYGQMEAIDYWVVRHAFEALRSRRGAASPLTYWINISGQSLGEEQFLAFVTDEVIHSGISPSSVCFEITETAVIVNLSVALRFIFSLRELGCRFALDDFGTGLSSFAHLRTLPVDYIKIAGRFIANLADSPSDLAIVQGIHHIARVMGIQTVAESVEDDATLEQLQAAGIDYAQGNRIGRATSLNTRALGAGCGSEGAGFSAQRAFRPTGSEGRKPLLVDTHP